MGGQLCGADACSFDVSRLRRSVKMPQFLHLDSQILRRMVHEQGGIEPSQDADSLASSASGECNVHVEGR